MSLQPLVVIYCISGNVNVQSYLSDQKLLFISQEYHCKCITYNAKFQGTGRDEGSKIYYTVYACMQYSQLPVIAYILDVMTFVASVDTVTANSIII